MPAPTKKRILLADDEPTILATLSAILRNAGYDVTAAPAVSDALREINSHPFDVLISDLNIGEPGDGFTVVSAMRRTHPECINLILTGYPAFETALQAIRNQVDDYLVKPANPPELLQSLQEKLRNGRINSTIMRQSVADFVDENAAKITERVLSAMKSDSRLAGVRLSDQQRVEHIPNLLSGIVQQLRSAAPDDPPESVLGNGALHGTTRREQGYSQEMLVDDVRLVDGSVYETVQDGLLQLDLSRLVPDLRHVNSALVYYLHESLKAYHSS
jgi:DNA-binding response OmpR family regulator